MRLHKLHIFLSPGMFQFTNLSGGPGSQSGRSGNPNFWHKYIVFFQNTMVLKRVLNPCQTRTLPVQTRTFCSGSEGSHLCHFCCNISTDSYDHMKIDIASESLVGDVGYLCYPLIKRELRSHQEFPNHMFVGGCGKECWNMLE